MQKLSNRITIRGKIYERDQVRAATVLLIPTMVVILFLFIIPAVQVVWYSFTNFNLTSGQASFYGIKNFTYILTDDKFMKALGNTFFFAFVKLAIDTTLALALALMLDAHIPVKRLLRSVYFAPVIVPVVASSLIWIWFFDPGIGPFNQILSSLKLPTSQWLYHENSALMSIIIFSVWKGVGYNMILFLAGLQNIPDSYIDAAKVDGANNWQMLVKIKLPLLRPIVAFVVMIGIINAFKVFAEINVMTPKGGPLYSTALMVVYIYEQAFQNAKMGRASAASLLLFIIIMIVTLIQRRLGGKKTIDLA
ncbi:MAG: sugar ABC transporter permease [Sphaerochaetaceae bacterium]|nr:sugar ABC transporter permease [Sphaerochaetaceae bacterium]NLO60821.1 sugar ABC transporter permease [Spirochaetales bacterium]MDD2405937.1 sugar ABC transporter permease [Sphaerochaetaceae bacterium]MDD3670341.1 sugar ABC transporter permease [Sphaerochaetaceae bacterium]MDD4260323.1 sugar ABC transporter permease [Sphaerochaetaceae bacterium]